MGFLRVFLVSVAACAASMLADLLLGIWNVGLGDWSRIALFLLISAAFLYFPTPKRQLSSGKQTKTEYILDGNGQLTERIFSPRDYSDYTELDKNSDGRVLANSMGTIVCTKYVRSEQGSDGLSRIHLLLLCLISAAMSMVFAGLWDMIRTGNLEVYLQSWSIQKEWPDLQSLLSILNKNLESLLNSISRIHPKLDIGQCMEIIVENLERLSILNFD